MIVNDFLKKFVEGYLFHDLDNMGTLGPLTGNSDGAAGYPMLLVTLSGVELLGCLISKKTFSPLDGYLYFLDYWDKCLATTNPEYKHLGKLFRNLVRHGLAHSFVAKQGILVTKRKPSDPKTFNVDINKKEIVIDCNDFYKDFKDSYFKYIQPLVFNRTQSKLTTITNMQNRLNEMVVQYDADSDKFFKEYINKKTTTMQYTSSPNSSGASLSLPRSAYPGPLQQSTPTSSTATFPKAKTTTTP